MNPASQHGASVAPHCIRIYISSLARRAALLLGISIAATAGGATIALTSVGSETLGELIVETGRSFQAQHPGVHIQVQTPGSASAPQALIEGAADIGPMSRSMTAAEQEKFVRRYGEPPGRIRVALDAIAVFVHPDNPLPSLQLAQLGEIYSSDHRCGAGVRTSTWHDLGIATPLAARPLLRIGRNTASGSFEFFREAALCNGSYRAEVVQFPGAGAIVAAVASQPSAIGYAGISHVNGLVKVLPVSVGAETVPITPDGASIRSGSYPLARPLYVYFNQRQRDARAAVTRQFLRYMLSDAGQALVRSSGLVPLAYDDLLVQRNTVE